MVVVPSNEQEEESFANENVMSKSNLRQPKSFNFGFPDTDDEEESGESEKSKGDEEEAVMEEVKKKT